MRAVGFPVRPCWAQPLTLRARAEPIRSSVPLQMFLFYNVWFSAAFFLAQIVLFVYKGAREPCKPHPPPRCALRNFHSGGVG